uniref:Uncharacterized protein n=1 Tax=Leersia perrieri TaxID=77586 RepID=A0A0D9VDZ1_9ORYZ
MARLHHLLPRALASHHHLLLLPSPPSSCLRPSLLPSPSSRTPPPRPPPPRPHGRRSMLPSLAAGPRHYASSRRASPMLRRRRAALRKGPRELNVQIGIEEALPDDPIVLSIAEALKTDVGKAVKVAFEILKSSEYETRDKSISNVNKYDTVEVSILLCDDHFIRDLNKEWRDEDHATDVLSMSQHIPGLDIPILQLGDIVISVETAQRQAEERGHTLLDEIRILMVHGLLHLLGFDHEISKVAEQEMEKGEEHILSTLEWKGKGLIKSAYDSIHDIDHSENNVGILDNEGHLHEESIESLREAVSRGTNVIMVTGKTRASTVRTFKLLDLEGKDNFISESSPGVFLQGSLVYGDHGQEIYRANLGVDICKEAFLYSLKYSIPLVAFCEEQCLTLFEHPFVDAFHNLHHEPKKLLFLDNVDDDSSVLRQHWSELTQGRARVIKAHSNTTEIVPLNVSKGSGIRILLDHLGITDDSDLDDIGDYTRWLSNKSCCTLVLGKGCRCGIVDGDSVLPSGGLALLYKRLALLGLDSKQANDPFEGLLAIILLHGLGREDKSQSGPSESSCNVLEDADDNGDGSGESPGWLPHGTKEPQKTLACKLLSFQEKWVISSGCSEYGRQRQIGFMDSGAEKLGLDKVNYCG